MKIIMKINNKIILPTLFFLFSVFVSLLYATEADQAEVLQRLEKEGFTPEDIKVERPEVVYSADALKDPFLTAIPQELETVSMDQEEIKLPELIMQGLIFGPKFPQVIINNKVLKVGEQISDVTITAISKNEVSVLFNHKYYTLATPATVVKTSQIQGGKK